jgi:hypothetical protein
VGSTLGVSRLPVDNPDLSEGFPASGHLGSGSVSTQVGVTEGIDVPSLQSAAPPGSHRAIHYRSLSDALLFTLVISGPVMLWESLWRGQPMIDQPGDLWIAPTVIVTAAFFVGGAIAGRHRRRATGAIAQGIALAIPVSLVLIIADIGRRLFLNKSLPLPVAELWLYALVGTVVVASLGALFGRRLYLREKKRKRMRKRTSPARR